MRVEDRNNKEILAFELPGGSLRFASKRAHTAAQRGIGTATLHRKLKAYGLVRARF